VYGGTYMLHRSDAKVAFDEASGTAVGVTATNENGELCTAKCKFVVGDPSYFPGGRLHACGAGFAWDASAC
jgi:hypothetical protein